MSVLFFDEEIAVICCDIKLVGNFFDASLKVTTSNLWREIMRKKDRTQSGKEDLLGSHMFFICCCFEIKEHWTSAPFLWHSNIKNHAVIWRTVITKAVLCTGKIDFWGTFQCDFWAIYDGLCDRDSRRFILQLLVKRNLITLAHRLMYFLTNIAVIEWFKIVLVRAKRTTFAQFVELGNELTTRCVNTIGTYCLPIHSKPTNCLGDLLNLCIYVWRRVQRRKNRQIGAIPFIPLARDCKKTIPIVLQIY